MIILRCRTRNELPAECYYDLRENMKTPPTLFSILINTDNKEIISRHLRFKYRNEYAIHDESKSLRSHISMMLQCIQYCGVKK